MELVKVIIGHKEAFVYPDEASNLIEKGLASYPKSVTPSENKMIETEYENKAVTPEIYWSQKQPKKKGKK